MITKFEVTNIKAIKKASFSPTGNLIALSGPCMRGKSSLADAAVFLLSGDQQPPVRTGEDAGQITATLRGGYIVERRLTADGKKSLAIYKIDEGTGKRMKMSRPAEVLSTLLGGIPVDVDDVLDMNPQEAVTLFLRLQGEEKVAALAALRQREKLHYDARGEATADAKKYRAAAEVIIVPDDIPTEMQVEMARKHLDEANALVAQALASEAEHVRLRQEAVKADDAYQKAIAAVRDLEARLANTKTALSEASMCSDAAMRAVSEFKVMERPDVAAVQKDLSELLAKREGIRLRQQKEELLRKADEHASQANSDDLLVQEARRSIRELFSGLGCVRWDIETNQLQGLNGTGQWVAFGDLSDSEGIVDMANILAGGGAPFVRIRHGAELDRQQMERLVAIAEHFPDTDFWVEIVRYDGDELILEGAEVEALECGPVAPAPITVEAGALSDEDRAAIERQMGDPSAAVEIQKPPAPPDAFVLPLGVVVKKIGVTITGGPVPQSDEDAPPPMSTDPNQGSLL